MIVSAILQGLLILQVISAAHLNKSSQRIQANLSAENQLRSKFNDYLSDYNSFRVGPEDGDEDSSGLYDGRNDDEVSQQENNHTIAKRGSSPEQMEPDDEQRHFRKVNEDFQELDSAKVDREVMNEGLEKASTNASCHHSGRNDYESENTSQLIFQIRYIFEGILVAIVANFGLIGNLLSMFILIRRKLDLQPFLCRLLVLLAVFDTVFLVTDFLTYSMPMISQRYNHSLNGLLAPKFLIPLSQIALTGSVYTIVAITVERYFACCWPLVPPREGRITNGLCIGGIILFSILYNVTRFFEYTSARRPVTEEELFFRLTNLTHDSNSAAAENTGGITLTDDQIVEIYHEMSLESPLEIVNTKFRTDPNYISYYLMAANSTVMVVIPLLSLVFLNWRIYKAIQSREKFRTKLQHRNGRAAVGNNKEHVETSERAKKNKERENTISRILVAIVVIFFITQSFKVVVVGHEVITYYFSKRDPCFPMEGYPFWVEIVINLNHVALAFNAAINIAIYICKDNKFRSACLDLIPSTLRQWCRENVVFGRLQDCLNKNKDSMQQRRDASGSDQDEVQQNILEQENNRHDEASHALIVVENGGSRLSSPVTQSQCKSTPDRNTVVLDMNLMAAEQATGTELAECRRLLDNGCCEDEQEDVC